jgi:raffinose/stachyose/melibiose transport system permease protein
MSTTDTQPIKAAAVAGESRRHRRRARPPAIGVLVKVASCIGLLLYLSPLIVIVLTAIQPQVDLIQRGPASIPHQVDLSNFTSAWTDGGLSTYYRNSLLITLVKVPVGVVLASLAAYPIAHLRFRGRKAIFVVLLFGLGVPQVITLFPLLQITRATGLGGTIWVLLLPYLAFGFPFEVLVMRGAFANVPRELVEAARIDRASEFYIWLRVCMPLVLPTLASLLILDGVATWNEFVIALTLINKQSNYTLPLGIFNLVGQFQSNYPELAAGVVICVAPMIVLFAVARRYLTAGVAAGGVKG